MEKCRRTALYWPQGMLDEVTQVARQNMRTVSAQVAFFVKQGLEALVDDQTHAQRQELVRQCLADAEKTQEI